MSSTQGFTEILRELGVKVVVPAALVAGISIWTLAHLFAEPGSEVSVLWGMVKYTKAQHERAQAPIAVAEVRRPSNGAIDILDPVADTHVSRARVVTGVSDYPDLNHYLVVSPLATGQRYVVDGPFSVSGGEWGANARFGEEYLGLGERFSLSVVATAQQLVEGELASLPADARTSSLVEVMRAK